VQSLEYFKNAVIKYCHDTVKDNGIALNQNQYDRIFEVFQRLHDDDEYAGTGIGLAIVKKSSRITTASLLPQVSSIKVHGSISIYLHNKRKLIPKQ